MSRNIPSVPAPRRSSPDGLPSIGHDGALAADTGGFRSPREFLLRVMDASLGRPMDSRLRPYLQQSLAAGADEHSTVSDPYGGFLLPAGFLPDLLAVRGEADPTVGRTTVLPVPFGKLQIPARVDKNHSSSVSGGLRVYRRNETDTVGSSRMETERVTLEPTSLFGLSYASEELLERSPIAFVALLEQGFRDEFASRLLFEKLFGRGVGEYEGVVNGPATVSVAKETGQGAATILYENVINMRARCYNYGNSIWLANHDTLPELMKMSLSVGTGGSAVWQPSAREDHPDMLLGRPLFFSEFCETVGTKGDIILGDWSQYLEGFAGNSEEVRMAESMHVRFSNHERTFKFWMESDGRCWWRSALTPKKSATTLSPFVVLATRA